MKKSKRESSRFGSESLGPFLGRLFISLIFIFAGFGKLFALEPTVEAFKALGFGQTLAMVGSITALALEIVGGLLVLLGLWTRLGVILLMIFLLPATLMFHNFWILEPPHSGMQLAHFLKNLTIYGGLILLLCHGPGRWSVDGRPRKN